MDYVYHCYICKKTSFDNIEWYELTKENREILLEYFPTKKVICSKECCDNLIETLEKRIETIFGDENVT